MSALCKIGNNIVLAKAALGMTTAELARLSGMSETPVAYMSNGSRDSGITRYIAIARAMGLTLGQLVGEQEMPHDRAEWRRRMGRI